MLPGTLIYLDNAETTRVDPRVAKVIQEYLLEHYGLPSGEFGHFLQEEASEAIEKAREVIASKIGAKPNEIVFTSGATESNNLAIKGLALAKGLIGKRIIVSAIEQRSVLDTALDMRGAGFQVHLLPVDHEGFVEANKLSELLEGACLVSIQHANQEIGTLQDLKTLGEICRSKDAFFHCDAAQSFARERIDVKDMNIDLLSMTSHLIHGPKGVGSLYVREGIKIQPLFRGDSREFGIRAGSQNVPGIMGFAEAVRLMNQEDIDKMRNLRDNLIAKLLEIEDSRLNGARGERRVCHNANITFRRVEGEALILHASMAGLICNTGSACYSQRLEPSHVITALGGSHEEAHGSTRLSVSKMTTHDETTKAVDIIQNIVHKLRSFSPMTRRK